MNYIQNLILLNTRKNGWCNKVSILRKDKMSVKQNVFDYSYVALVGGVFKKEIRYVTFYCFVSVTLKKKKKQFVAGRPRAFRLGLEI